MLTEDRSQRSVLRFLRYAHSLFKGLFTLFLLLVLLTSFVATVFKVDGYSMDPTLKNGQLMPVYLGYRWFGTPERGQVVLITFAAARKEYLVKRITGVPGDIVQFQGEPYVLAENEYFVVGDNPDASTDSRTFGPISRAEITGLVIGNFSENSGGN